MGFFDDLKQEVTNAAADLRTQGVKNLRDSGLAALNNKKAPGAPPVQNVVGNMNATILPQQYSFMQGYLPYIAVGLVLILILKRRG